MDQKNAKTSIAGVSKGTAELHPAEGAQSFRGVSVFFFKMLQALVTETQNIINTK